MQKAASYLGVKIPTPCAAFPHHDGPSRSKQWRSRTTNYGLCRMGPLLLKRASNACCSSTSY
eukprot:scaffold266382_cov30-Tisochrysis_lutea.AAC.1